MESTFRGCNRNHDCDPAAKSVKIAVKFSVIVRVNNGGAIFKASIITTTSIPNTWIKGTSM